MDAAVRVSTEHKCPVCIRRYVPHYVPMCNDCFDVVPWRLRGDFVQAHRFRVLNKARYEESVAAVRQWYIGWVEEMEEL